MYFDVAMPLTLFMVITVAMLLERKVEGKLKSVFEEREFGVRDAVLFVAAISVTVSLVVFIPQMAIMTLFLFAYSMLLFIFTYLFSDFQKTWARVFCTAFLIVSFLAATISLFNISTNSTAAYGALAFFCLFGFTFLALLYEEKRANTAERWYLAVMPPALFIFLYLFFGGTPIWFPYLLNLYGIVFAVLIILYLGSLFTWKTTLIFSTLLTIMDVILVLVTGTMVSAATTTISLNLPVVVALPILPALNGIMLLGLGDFFFAGLLAIQTFKKFGKSFAISSVIAMSASFFVFEALLLTYRPGPFPGTVMIICGWLPLMLWKGLKH